MKSFLLLALGSLPIVFGQTWSSCNPMEKDNCPADPALSAPVSQDFSNIQLSGSSIGPFGVAFNEKVFSDGEGLHMRVATKGDAPTLTSNFYILWGRVDILMRAAPGKGIVSSLVFQSDILDEIDIEFVGSQTSNIQTNIFSKGRQDVHIYGEYNGVSDILGFHTYSIDWSPEKIDWLYDGGVVRTMYRNAVGDVNYPQTPMQIKFGPWAAGDSSAPKGTMEWADGPIDYNAGPFDMVVKSIKVTNGSPANSYRYKDRSGSSGSIEIIGGGAQPTSSAPPPPRSTTAPPPPPSSTSAPPPPPPKSTKTIPPPPPQPTTTSTSSSTPASSSSSSVPPPQPTSTKASTSSTATTFIIVPTNSDSDKPTTTLETSITTGTDSPTSSSTFSPGSGASVTKTGWSLLVVAGAFVLMM